MKKINIIYTLLVIAFFTNAITNNAQVAGITELSMTSFDSAVPPNIIDTEVIGDGITAIQSYQYYANPLVIESNGVIKADVFYQPPSPGQTVYLRIWLDANGNGIFEVSEILTSTSSSTGVFSPSPTIPVSALDIELTTMQFVLYDDSNYTNEISTILLSVTEFSDPPPIIVHTSGKGGIVTFEEVEELYYCLPISNRIVFFVKYEQFTTLPIASIELNENELVDEEDYTYSPIEGGEHPQGKFVIDIDQIELEHINRLDCIVSGNDGIMYNKGFYFTLGCCPSNIATYDEYNPPPHYSGASDRISLGNSDDNQGEGGLLEIETDDEYSFQAVNGIEFHPGIEIEGDGFLYAYINPCANNAGDNYRIIETEDQIVPSHPSNFYKVSPNPFSDFVTIAYSLLEKDIVNLSLYNVNGQMIQQLVRDELQMDFNEIQLDTSTLPQGTYFVKLQLGQSIYTKKIVKL